MPYQAIREFCAFLVCHEVGLTIVMSGLFISIVVVHIGAVAGRRRLWRDKADKDVIVIVYNDLKKRFAELENRVWLLGTRKPQPPLPDEVVDILNGNAEMTYEDLINGNNDKKEGR